MEEIESGLARVSKDYLDEVIVTSLRLRYNASI